MRKNIKIILLIFIVLTVSMLFFKMVQYEGTASAINLKLELSMKTDSPISINGNAALNSTATSGNGTAGNPYVIEKKIINVSGLGVAGIDIQNTDAYFILRNCTITNAGPGFSGIKLSNVTNGKIVNVSTNNNTRGIYLEDSNYNALSNNTANHNGIGIFLSDSMNNTLINNTVNHNSNGIYLSFSDNNTFKQNIIFYNMEQGIYLYYSGNNRLNKNQFRENGIRLKGNALSTFIQEITPDNTIGDRPIYYYKHQKANTVPTDAAQVILVNCTFMNVLGRNLSSGSLGLSLFHSDNNTLADNMANNNYYGFYLFKSNNNTLRNNTANLNYDHSIYLYYSNNNTLSNNTANDNVYGGMYLFYSHNNTLRNNTAQNNDYGISLDESNNNKLTNNTTYHNVWGIRLEDSNNNTVSFNIANENNWYGIQLVRSNYNNVTWNTFHYNGICWSQTPDCMNNTIENNYCRSREDIVIPPIPGFLWKFILFGLIVVFLIDTVKRRHQELQNRPTNHTIKCWPSYSG